jgi:hypothetical protein
MDFSRMTSAHFVLIPAVLLIGMVLGWILGSRAAADAYAADLKRREERAARKSEGRGSKVEDRGPGTEPRGSNSGDPV